MEKWSNQARQHRRVGFTPNDRAKLQKIGKKGDKKRKAKREEIQIHPEQKEAHKNSLIHLAQIRS